MLHLRSNSYSHICEATTITTFAKQLLLPHLRSNYYSCICEAITIAAFAKQLQFPHLRSNYYSHICEAITIHAFAKQLLFLHLRSNYYSHICETLKKKLIPIIDIYNSIAQQKSNTIISVAFIFSIKITVLLTSSFHQYNFL